GSSIWKPSGVSSLTIPPNPPRPLMPTRCRRVRSALESGWRAQQLLQEQLLISRWVVVLNMVDLVAVRTVEVGRLIGVRLDKRFTAAPLATRSLGLVDGSRT